MTERLRALAAVRRAERVADQHRSALEDAYTAQLRAMCLVAADNLEARAFVASAAPWTPPDDDEVLPVAPAAAAVVAATEPTRRAMVGDVGQSVADAYGATYDLDNPIVQQVLAQLGANITAITEDERAAIVAAIAEAQAAGLSVPNTAALIRGEFADLSRTRATLIARTEVRGAANGAAWAAIMQLNALAVLAGDAPPFPYKQWLATNDTRTRLDHAVADGQTVLIAQAFAVGGEAMLYPGDQHASPDETCNCRCSMTYPESITAAGGPPMSKRTKPTSDMVAATISRQQAIRAAAAETETVAAVGGAWSSILAPLNVVTDDGRLIDGAGGTTRDLPLTLMAMHETPEFGGHGGAKIAGRIDSVDFGADALTASGVFDTGEFGAETERLVNERTLTGISVDLAVTEYEWRDMDGHVLDDEAVWYIDEPVVFAMLQWKLLGATVCPMPAFADASISTIAAASGSEFRVSIIVPFGGLTPPVEGLTASAAGLAPVTPPSSWFADPELAAPTPFTVTNEGRVFGHIALWGTCHIGHAGSCVEPPSNQSGYAFFHLGALATDDGDQVDVGTITLGTSHADLSAGYVAASEHYDHTGTGAADVTLGEDAHGIWCAGAIRSDLPAERVRELRASKMSGDWRPVNGRYELVGVLAVNVPGFPVPRARYAVTADGRHEPTALIAAGMVPTTPEGLARREERMAQRDDGGLGARARVAGLYAHAVGHAVVLDALAARAAG